MQLRFTATITTWLYSNSAVTGYGYAALVTAKSIEDAKRAIQEHYGVSSASSNLNGYCFTAIVPGSIIPGRFSRITYLEGVGPSETSGHGESNRPKEAV